MNTKLKCLLLDDELKGLSYLKMLCEQIPGLEVIKAFNDPGIFLKEVPALEFDLCILDIEMPGINGLQVANLLNHKPVIFVTAFKDYAAEAFDLNAIDYVRKPIMKERLQQAVGKARTHLSKKRFASQFIHLNTSQGKTMIFIDQLVYIKASSIDSRDKQAVLSDGSDITLKNISFEKLQEMLPEDDFARINKKEMLALKAVQLFSSDEITTNIATPNGDRLKLGLSEVYRKDFLQKVKL